MSGWRFFDDRGATAVQQPAPPKPDSPEEWLRWRRLSLVDERGIVDPDGLMRGKAHGDRMRAQMPPGRVAGIGNNSWSSLGPGNIGGRIRALVIHPTNPDTMLIGSVSGGIWKTTDGGATWSAQDDFMANLAVSSIVMRPGAPETMYAGTGEGFFNADGLVGAGIFKTTNGGTTWSQLPSTSTSPSTGLFAYEFQYVNRVAMSPDGLVLLAATWTGIYRSTNGGATFTRSMMVGGDFINSGYGVMDVDFDPLDSDRAVAALHSGAALFSLDRGASWTLAAGLPGPLAGFEGRAETAIAPSNGSIVYASIDVDGGSLYKSINGGQSYSEVFDGAADPALDMLGNGWYDNTVWISPTDSNLVVWGGLDLFRSTDGGVSFDRISLWYRHNYSNPTSAHADQHIAVAHPGYNGTSNRTVFFGNDGGIYRAADIMTVGGGADPFQDGWTELNNGLAITQFYGAAGHAGTGRITAGTQDNGTLFLDPGISSASEDWTAPFGGDGGFSAYDSSDANYFYGEYTNAQIHRNSSGGSGASEYIFAGLTDAGTSAAEFIAAFVRDPGNDNRLLVAALRLWRTNDAKAAVPSWEVIKNPVDLDDRISAIAVAAQNSNVVYVGYNSGRLYKTNSGTGAAATVLASWSTLDDNGVTNPLPNRRITRITVGDAVNGIHPVYVTFGGFSGDNIYRSMNGGGSWTDITGPDGAVTALPNVPVRDLEIHPFKSNWLYAGTEVGIFASVDGGTTWALPHDGPANVSVDELFFLNTTLYAATHGRGLFSSETVTAFTDPVLTAGGTRIRAVHVTELRTRINAVRLARGLAAVTWTDPTLTPGVTLVKAGHITELRTALASAYIAAGMTPPTYSSTPAPGGPILVTAIAELRLAVIGVE